jgi:23S rRNA pseudouridine1911/1915/1917 synthase
MNIGELVLLKNNQFIIFNKPPGIPVQGDKTKDKALINLAEIYTKSTLYLIHRIDRPASGILLFAKNKKAVAQLGDQFKNRKTAKKYLAVVQNKPEFDEGQLKHYLIKNGKTNRSQAVEQSVEGAKEAILNYKLIGSIDNYYLLEIELLTGRHHQIRAQLAAINCPIKGDVKYGARRGNKDRSIHLHAWKLSFQHPISKEKIELTAPLPEDNVWKAFEIE